MSESTIGVGQESISLESALEQAGCLHDGKAIAIVSGFDAIRFARVAGDGRLDFGPGVDSPIAPFDARAFNGRGDLRWVRSAAASNGEGTAVLLAPRIEDRPAWRDPIGADLVEHSAATKQRFLLWGVVDRRIDAAWAVLFEGRVGEILVPASDTQPGDRLALCYEEVLAVDDDWGNVAVRAERLTGLARVPMSTARAVSDNGVTEARV